MNDFVPMEESQVVEVPEISESIDDSSEPLETPEIAETPEPVEIPDTDDITFHPRPGGIETLPNVEGEPIETPHTPEIPYGGGNHERGW